MFSPDIIIDPKIAYGKRSHASNLCHRKTLYEIWRAETDNIPAVADWFGILQKKAEWEVGPQGLLRPREALAGLRRLRMDLTSVRPRTGGSARGALRLIHAF